MNVMSEPVYEKTSQAAPPDQTRKRRPPQCGLFSVRCDYSKKSDDSSLT
jgi:hypothetical protein